MCSPKLNSISLPQYKFSVDNELYCDTGPVKANTDCYIVKTLLSQFCLVKKTNSNEIISLPDNFFCHPVGYERIM